MKILIRSTRKIKSLTIGLSKYLNAIVRLISQFLNFRCADIIVIMQQGGFGHTVVTVDISRRLYPKKSIFVLCICGENRYNPYTKYIWGPGINVSFIELSWQSYWFVSFHWIAKIFLILTKNKKTRIFLNAEDFREELRPLVPIRAYELPYELNIAWVAGYFALIDRTKDILPPCLNDKLSVEIEYALGLNGTDKIATFYVRQKGGDISASSRSGSPLENYFKTLQYLSDIGYSIFLTGDYEYGSMLEARIYTKEYAEAKGVSSDLFQLYAVAKASLCVSESGGGAWLPMIFQKPHLCINAFPYWYAMKDAWIYPKRVKKSNSDYLKNDELFGKLLYKHDVGYGLSLENNSSSEIFEAICEFIEVTKKMPIPRMEIRCIPARTTWYNYSEAVILNCWFRDKTATYLTTQPILAN